MVIPLTLLACGLDDGGLPGNPSPPAALHRRMELPNPFQQKDSSEQSTRISHDKLPSQSASKDDSPQGTVTKHWTSSEGISSGETTGPKTSDLRPLAIEDLLRQAGAQQAGTPSPRFLRKESTTTSTGRDRSQDSIWSQTQGSSSKDRPVSTKHQLTMTQAIGTSGAGMSTMMTDITQPEIMMRPQNRRDERSTG